MRSRTTAAVLAAGLTLIGGGTAAATTGPAGSGIAGEVQYQPEQTGTVPVTPPTELPVTTTEASVTPPPVVPAPPVVTPTTPSQTPTEREAKPTTSAPSQTPTAESVAQTTPTQTPVAQSSASSLPFTGFDLVPVAIAGLALLALGAVLRRHGRRDQG